MTDLVSYISFLRMDSEEDREEFMHYIQFMDGIFMTKVDEKAKTPKKK